MSESQEKEYYLSDCCLTGFLERNVRLSQQNNKGCFVKQKPSLKKNGKHSSGFRFEIVANEN
jgi:hypothetical protein